MLADCRLGLAEGLDEGLGIFPLRFDELLELFSIPFDPGFGEPEITGGDALPDVVEIVLRCIGLRNTASFHTHGDTPCD